MGKMSDQHIEKQEELNQEELEQQDLDEQQQAIAELNHKNKEIDITPPEETVKLLKKAGFKLVFRDEDLAEMIKAQERSKK